jgi:hypothetical protein
MENPSKRVALRKQTEQVSVSRITSLRTYSLIASNGLIIDASSSGFLLHVSRKSFGPTELRTNLVIDSLIGEPVVIHIEQMDLDMEGQIVRTKHIGRGIFEVAIDFSDDSPEYWRECLLELLPNPGEMDD